MRLLATWAVLGAASCSPAAGTAERGGGPRIVSLHEVTTEIVVTLGRADALVGVTEPVSPSRALAAAVAGVPRVGGLESIVAREPTLVLGMGVVAERDPDVVRALRRAGIAVDLRDPVSVDDLLDWIDDIAAGVDAPTAADALRQRLPAAAPAGHRPVRTFVYDCCDPPFTAGGAGLMSDLLGRAGARNVYDDIDADWAHVSWEQTAARRPALIIVHAYDLAGQADVAGKRAQLARVPALADVPVAVVPLRVSLGGIASVHGLPELRAAVARAVRTGAP